MIFNWEIDILCDRLFCFLDNVHNVKVFRNCCGAVEMSHIAVYHTSSKSALDRNNGSELQDQHSCKFSSVPLFSTTMKESGCLFAKMLLIPHSINAPTLWKGLDYILWSNCTNATRDVCDEAASLSGGDESDCLLPHKRQDGLSTDSKIWM